MCPFCRKSVPRCASSLALCSFQSPDGLSSEESDSWSVSSSGTMCSEHYIKLRNRFLWSGRKEGHFKRVDSQLKSPLKSPSARWRDSVKDSQAQEKVKKLEFEIKQKDKMLKEVIKENRKLKEECSNLKRSQSHMKMSDQIVDKLKHEFEVQRKESAKINDLLRQIDKLSTQNSELRMVASRNQYQQKAERNKNQQFLKIQEIKDRQQQFKPERFLTEGKESTWRDNFITVFIQLMSKIKTKEGFLIKQRKSLKRQAKSSWRFLKQFIHSYYKEQSYE